MPPKTLSVSASATNCITMSLVVAPTARRMPIPRVLSVTDTSMMFITPTPPTTSEIPAMLPSRIDRVLLTPVGGAYQVVLALNHEIRLCCFVPEEQEFADFLLDPLTVSAGRRLDVNLRYAQVSAGGVQET